MITLNRYFITALITCLQFPLVSALVKFSITPEEVSREPISLLLIYPGLSQVSGPNNAKHFLICAFTYYSFSRTFKGFSLKS